MVKGVLTAADIKGVAVGEKRFASKLPHIVHHDLCILRPEMGEIAEFPKVDLDGGIVIRKVDLFKPGPFQQPVQLLRQRLAGGGVEIGKEYCAFFH